MFGYLIKLINFLNSFLDKNFSWSHVQTPSHNAHWKALGKVHLEVSKRIGCCPRTSADEQTPTGRYKHTVSRAVRCAPRAHGRQKHWRTRRKVARNAHIYRSARVHLQARLKRTDKLTDTYLFVVFSSSQTLLICSKIRACSKTAARLYVYKKFRCFNRTTLHLTSCWRGEDACRASDAYFCY